MSDRRTRELVPPRPRSLGARSTRIALKALGVAIVVAIILPPLVGGVAVTTLLFGELPGRLPEQKPNFVALPSTVYDAHGNQIAVLRQFELTVPMTPEDLPQVLTDAVVAAEDQRYWDHNGVDLQGVARAAWINYAEGEAVQGGSTITQQYVKNAYLSGERTLSRKLREAILATQLERTMTKEEILFNYLDSVYFGSGAYGAGAAAKVYFDKPVQELDISESAMLAGLIPAPTAWSPRIDVAASETRRLQVLDAMFEQGLITEAQYVEARARQVWLLSDGQPPGPATVVHPLPERGASQFPYFVDWVEQELLATYGPERLYRGGLRIETSIDPTIQAQAVGAVRSQLDTTSPPVDMALAAVEPSTGLVKAMVSGRDYSQSQVNLGLGGVTGFQPGSSFKTFVLAAALEEGISPDTVYPAPGRWKVPGCAGEGCFIGNYGGGGYGAMSLEAATRSSVNTVYAQLILDVGIKRTAEMARRLGISTVSPDEPYGVSLALGAAEVSPLDMASAYGTFANLGVRQEPTPIVKVFDKDGQILEDNSARGGQRVLATNVAATVTDILSGVVDRGTAVAAKLPDRPAAGKTGTAEEWRAAWFVGYVPQLSVAVWIGHTDGQRTLAGINGVSRVTGGSIPAATWATFMREATKDLPVVEFPDPGPLQAEPDPDFVPSAGVAAAVESFPGQPDLTPRVNRRATPRIVTPADCNGPCQLYGGSLIDIPPAPATTAPPAPEPSESPPPSSEGPPTGSASESAAASPDEPTNATPSADSGNAPPPEQNASTGT